jgi:glucose/arabinose dehydrogenase
MLQRRLMLAAALVLALSSPLLAQLDPIPQGTIRIFLNPVATGMGAPDYAISPAGDLSRMFIIEQQGQIKLMVNDVLQPGNVLDIQSRISTSHNPASANDERGFLGLAFHPQFNNPTHPGFGKLYTYNSEPTTLRAAPTFAVPNNATRNFDLVVAEWTMGANNVVDPLSRREVLSIGHNASNHNGGTLAFGPDGYLYMAPGDGGNANDVGASHVEPGGNAQFLGNVLGKVLRIDPINPTATPGSADPVSTNGQYRIPTDNPFRTTPDAMHEIYAYGLRNPYRFAFDRLNGDLILADVGQNRIEEIDKIVKGGNYGWAVKEGTFLFNRTNGTIGANSPGSPAGMIDPISGPGGTLQYDHDDGISITGGFVYRGAAIPELFGKYVFGDLALRNNPPRVDGRLFYADLQQGTIHEFLLPQFPDGKLPNGLTVHGFGENGAGELYALVTNTPPNGTGGITYKLEFFVPEPAILGLLTPAVFFLIGRRKRAERI